jgi:hypothetical protein
MDYKLFLDDYRNPANVKWINIPSGPYTIVRNYDEFVNTISELGIPEHVSFDHDLADNHYENDFSNEKTGLECAEWLINTCQDLGQKFPTFTVHSMNPVGSLRIKNAIVNAYMKGRIRL